MMKAIDIPIEGWEDVCNPNAVYEKVNLGKKFYQAGDLSTAQSLWEEASDCGNDLATFFLALLAKRQNRYKEAEQLLLRLRTRHTDLEGRIDLELADLYHRAGMPVSALGFLLMARNAGEDVCDIDKYHRAFKHADIHASTDCHGAYILGTSLIKAGVKEKGVYFLRQAIQHGEGKWVSFAALDLAEAYQSFPGCEEEAAETQKLAADLGNPEILRRKKS